MTDEKVIQLRSVQVLKKTGLKIGYEMLEKLEAGDVKKFYTIDCDAEPTQEFDTALRLLIPHMLSVCELSPIKIDGQYLQSRAAVNDSKLEKFRITKVEVIGDGEDEEIVLYGKKHLKFKRVVEFKTPPIKCFGKEANYEFSGNLHEDKENLFDEVEAYLGGKFTPAAQFEMQM